MFIQRLIRVFMIVFFGLRVENAQLIPDTACFVCANHKSNWDPPALGCSARRRYTYIAKAELFKNPLMAWLFRALGCTAVRRDEGDARGVKAILQLLRDGEAVVLFPEGSRVRKGKVSDAKTGPVKIAALMGAPIVPVGIKGNYRLFGRITIVYGPPIYYQWEKRPDNNELERATEALMKNIYELAGERR